MHAVHCLQAIGDDLDELGFMLSLPVPTASLAAFTASDDISPTPLPPRPSVWLSDVFPVCDATRRQLLRVESALSSEQRVILAKESISLSTFENEDTC